MKQDRERHHAAITHHLIISSPNHGGLLGISPGGPRILDFSDTTGLYHGGSHFLRAHQTQNQCHLDVLEGNHMRRLLLPEVSDIHDVCLYQGRIYAVSTGTNEILSYNPEGKLIERITFPGEGDSWHINCLGLIGGRLTIGAFGKFEKFRDWAGGRSKDRGFVTDLNDIQVRTPLLSGLDQPHTQREHDGAIYICDSHNHTVIRLRDGKRESLRFPHYFTRGLAFAGDTLYVGLSSSRNIPTLQSRGALAVVDLPSLTLRRQIELPFAEVYDITAVDEQTYATISLHYLRTETETWDYAMQSISVQQANAQKLRQTAQLFWSQNGKSEETNSIRLTYPNNEFVRLNFEMPLTGPVSHLRFDPCESCGEIEITRMALEEVHSGRVVWEYPAQSEKGKLPFVPCPGMHLLPSHDIQCWAISTDDAFIILPPVAHGTALNFSVELHFNPSLPNLKKDHDQLIRSQETLRTESTKLKKDHDQLIRSQETLRTESTKLKRDHEQLIRTQESLCADSTRKADLIATLYDQLNQLHNTWSWRITSPFRDLARKCKSKETGFFCHVDLAPDPAAPANPMTFAGWFLDKNFQVARSIRIRVGCRTIICRPVSRPDLTPHFSQLGDKPVDAGFLHQLSTDTGPKIVTLEAETQSGQVVKLWRKLLWMPQRQATDGKTDYPAWLEQNQDQSPAPSTGPLISILMPVYNPPERWLRKAIESVQHQSYVNWELCIANDASTSASIRPQLDSYVAIDSRIKVFHREKNGHISACSNTALDLCTGLFTALLDHDDELAPDALSEVVQALQKQPGARILYSDEDKIDTEGHRFAPYFKPDWNPDLLRSQNYFCHLSVYQTVLLREIGGFRAGFEGAQDWDLALRATERVNPQEIVHIPKVLYHWRAIPGSTALSQSQKDYHQDAAHKALSDHIARTGLAAEIEPVKGGHWRLKYRLPDTPPRVSLIIPTRNRVEILKPCIDSILRLTTYPNYEIIIVDNGSDQPATLDYFAHLKHDQRITVLRDDGPFNYSALNNRAARQASGELLALVNNDIEPISPDWLDEMVSQAIRPGIGAVGAMLYYPDDTVQHAGVVLGIAGPQLINGIAGHAFKKFNRGHTGSMNRMRLVQNYSAVTAACLVIRKAIYEEVGGLDEKNLTVSFNDVDFCIRVFKAGYRNLWTPFAELYHHESASRGKEDSPQKIARAKQEADYMRATWGDILDNDPAYNPNLTLVHEDFSLSWPARIRTS
jgi:O-antigen biosynthesis protein